MKENSGNPYWNKLKEQRFDTIQCENLKELLINNLNGLDIITSVTSEESTRKANSELLSSFISAKKIEGGSAKTLKYYENTIIKMFSTIKKPVAEMSTNDIRTYLAEYQEERHLSKVTVDNIRRIFSSFFSWLEDEDLILKKPGTQNPQSAHRHFGERDNN